jgi:hypothetical protein
MVLIGLSLDSLLPPGPFLKQCLVALMWVHWPLLPVYNRKPSLSVAFVVVLAYWIAIGVGAGLLFVLVRDWAARKRGAISPHD